MTIIFECSRPASGPFYYKSRIIRRAGFLWFAVAVLRVPFPEFATTSYNWRTE